MEHKPIFLSESFVVVDRRWFEKLLDKLKNAISIETFKYNFV